MDYEKLSREDFDAIVTGELTHYAIWLEHEVIAILSDYFVGMTTRRADFEKLILMRDGLTFQDKIEILRALVPSLRPPECHQRLLAALKRVEAFKGTRNALAHGIDVTPPNVPGTFVVEIVNRAGKEKAVTITPESHAKMCADADALLTELQWIRGALDYKR